MCLPKFIIPGAAKAGTTAIGVHLRMHPQIYLPIQNPLYFSKKWGTLDYKSLYVGKEKFVCGDKSPTYLLGIQTYISRIYKTIPDAKIIITVRNPVDLIYSKYQMVFRSWVRHKTPTIPFVDLVNQELSKVKKGQMLKFTDDECGRKHNQVTYLRDGFYAKQMGIITSMFGKENIFVSVQERMLENTQKEMNMIFNFLEVPKIKLEEIVKLNNRYPPLKHNIRALLVNLFKKPNSDFYEMIGFQIDEWDR